MARIPPPVAHTNGQATSQWSSTMVDLPTIATFNLLPPIDFKTNTNSPADSWETAFVWGFLLRFTPLKGQVEGLENVKDFENALVEVEQSLILHAILAKFIDNLSPRRNTNLKQISSSLYALINDFCAGNERSVWWNTARNKNLHPFSSDLNFFALGWQEKIVILRQLVEWQLAHNADVRNLLDRAHGVVRGGHRKRADDTPRPVLIPPDPEHTREKLQFVPLGLDSTRKRYWVIDDSPRIYISGNPWKTSCPFHAVSTTREEYLDVIQSLKDNKPKRAGKKPGKLETSHDELIKNLEGPQLAKIDAELARIAQVQKRQREKLRAKEVAAAQAELRETRTRIKVNKVDYVYDMGSEHEEGVIYDDGEEIDELDDDEYNDDFGFQQPGSTGQSRKNSTIDEDEDYLHDDLGNDSEHTKGRRKGKAKGRNGANGATTRRSGRGSLKQGSEDQLPPRGERRSSRRSTLSRTQNGGGSFDPDDDQRPTKRARLSSVGSSLPDSQLNGSGQTPTVGLSTLSINGTAGGASKSTSSLKPGEKIIETVAGKKRSKFWYYVVESVPEGDTDQEVMPPEASENTAISTPPLNGDSVATVREDGGSGGLTATGALNDTISLLNGAANGKDYPQLTNGGMPAMTGPENTTSAVVEDAKQPPGHMNGSGSTEADHLPTIDV